MLKTIIYLSLLLLLISPNRTHSKTKHATNNNWCQSLLMLSKRIESSGKICLSSAFSATTRVPTLVVDCGVIHPKSRHADTCDIATFKPNCQNKRYKLIDKNSRQTNEYVLLIALEKDGESITFDSYMAGWPMPDEATMALCGRAKGTISISKGKAYISFN
jgi:hypothetical protein